MNADSGGFLQKQLIERRIHTGIANPGDDWIKQDHNGRVARLVYKVRMRCNNNHFGFNCTKFCEPRTDHFGHYTCDRNGNKKCMDGWMGKDCEKRKLRS